MNLFDSGEYTLHIQFTRYIKERRRPVSTNTGFVREPLNSALTPVILTSDEELRFGVDPEEIV